MQREYYLDISLDVYNSFKDEFKNNVLKRLKETKDIIPEIKYWGAGALVQKLKDPNDTFSNFFPPRVASDYKSDVLAYEQGIGIKGEITSRGYLVRRVELRSDAYMKGIRPNDLILKIDGRDVLGLDASVLKEKLFPPLNTHISLEVLFSRTGKIKEIDIEVLEFFKETLSSIPTRIPGLFYIKINHFNKKTSEDLTRVMKFFLLKNIKKLIIDLRGNSGGPPLAAREIAGMFLPKNQELFYFQRKNRPKALLKTLSSPIHFSGRIAILIDEGSGSASELFAGTMRHYERAILIGTRSAGKTFLKSMFNFQDKSMLVLVTSPAYLFDGSRYNPKGLEPDFRVKQDIDLFAFVSDCIDKYYEE